jgi:polysaccharide biosynthesis protein PslH
VKILVLTSRFPWPPDRGDRLTACNVLRVLSARRHDVTLVSFTDGGEPADAIEQVSRHCARVETVPLPRWRSWLQAWAGLPLPVPSQVSFYRSGRMRDRVRRLAETGGFDVVFAQLIRMAPYAADLPQGGRVMWLADSLGLALDRSRHFAPWWKRPGIRWERRRVDRFTARMSRRFEENWAISPADIADLQRIGCERLELVTHGVDERLFGVARRTGVPPRVVFLGNLSVPHNVDAALFAVREVWPAIRAAVPAARLLLAGADPVPAVRDAAAEVGVEVTGPLPDLLDLWATADVMLAPLRFSTGIQNKVLEAMAAGVPVVTTPPVAAALGTYDGEHLLTAHDAPGLAAAVAETLRDPAAAAKRAERAREHVRAHFNWDAIARGMERVAGAARTTPAGPDSRAGGSAAPPAR